MKQIAPGVRQLRSPWPNLINTYLVEDLLVDAATRWDRRFILHQLRGQSCSALALTHAHPDHQGSAAAICRALNIPLAVHAADAASAQGAAPLLRQSRLLDLLGNLFLAGPRHPVSRILHDGDSLAGFRVLHTPGHTPGHIILFRDSDRVAITGDLLCTGDPALLTFPILRQPPYAFSFDPGQNRASIRKLWSLQPTLICPGHGAPLRDMRKLERFISRLPP